MNKYGIECKSNEIQEIFRKVIRTLTSPFINDMERLKVMLEGPYKNLHLEEIIEKPREKIIEKIVEKKVEVIKEVQVIKEVVRDKIVVVE
jgi:anaerobic ribonucleoside-triphosphate reductase